MVGISGIKGIQVVGTTTWRCIVFALAGRPFSGLRPTRTQISEQPFSGLQLSQDSQSQVSLFWPFTGQFILTNGRTDGPTEVCIKGDAFWQMIHSEGEIDGDNEKKKNQVAEPSWEQSYPTSREALQTDATSTDRRTKREENNLLLSSWYTKLRLHKSNACSVIWGVKFVVTFTE